jgi:hypothetical protein
LTYKSDVLIEDGVITEMGKTCAAMMNQTPPAA